MAITPNLQLGKSFVSMHANMLTLERAEPFSKGGRRFPKHSSPKSLEVFSGGVNLHAGNSAMQADRWAQPDCIMVVAWIGALHAPIIATLMTVTSRWLLTRSEFNPQRERVLRQRVGGHPSQGWTSPQGHRTLAG
jgi:hypothetical protein